MKDLVMPKSTTRAGALGAVAFLLLSVLQSVAQLPPEGPMREWTFPGGCVTTKAALQTFDGKTAVVRLLNG